VYYRISDAADYQMIAGLTEALIVKMAKVLPAVKWNTMLVSITFDTYICLERISKQSNSVMLVPASE
jgi:hypothetical protein